MKSKTQDEIWKDKLEECFNKINEYNDIESFTEEDRDEMLCSILDNDNIIDHWNWLQSKQAFKYFSDRFPLLHDMIDASMEAVKESWEEGLEGNIKQYLGPMTADGISLSYIKMYLNL